MKKTIIAAALSAAVAAPAAMADVSISGGLFVEAIQNDADSWGQGGPRGDLVFTASEDLGNGMKASVKLHQSLDAAAAMADQTVSLSGDFGTFTMGRMEFMHESVMQPVVSIDESHDLDLENITNNNGIGDRGNSAMAYSSPSMNGLSVTVAIAAAGGATGSDLDDVTDVLVKYSNGPLTVMADQIDNGTDEATAFSASYKMGDLTVSAMTREYDDAGTKYDTNFFGAKYTMGANTIAVGRVDDDLNGDGTIVSLSHALSKRTSAYIVSTSIDPTAANTTEDDELAFGLRHTF
jgi:predicted porin